MRELQEIAHVHIASHPIALVCERASALVYAHVYAHTASHPGGRDRSMPVMPDGDFRALRCALELREFGWLGS